MLTMSDSDGEGPPMATGAVVRSGIVLGWRWKLSTSVLRHLFRAAATCKVDLRVHAVESGWFRNTVYFRVEGQAENVQRFTSLVGADRAR